MEASYSSDITNQQESLLESLQGDVDGSMPLSEYQHNTDEPNFTTSLFSPNTEDPTDYLLMPNNWYFCPRIVITEQGKPLQGNSNGLLPPVTSSNPTISSHILDLNQSSPPGAADYEGPPMSQNWQYGNAMVYNELGYYNGASGIVNTKQGQFSQGNSNGLLSSIASSIVSSFKRKRNADLEQGQNATNTPNKKRVNNDKNYTTSVNDAIIKLGRQIEQLPDDFEFSREQSTKNIDMSKKGILEHVSVWINWAIELIAKLKYEIAEFKHEMAELKYENAKLKERNKLLEERFENNDRTLRQTHNTVNENINHYEYLL